MQFEIKNNKLTVKDIFGTENTIAVDPNIGFCMVKPDLDGYVLFYVYSIKPVKPNKVSLPTQSEAHVNGYTLFHTNLSKSCSYGTQKSVFEYYKRENDLSYYEVIKKEGKKDRKILFGSLRDPTSRMFQVARLIDSKFKIGETFKKADLYGKLSPSLSNARIIKGTLDILTKEGYLEAHNTTSGRKNTPLELFTKSDKLQKFMADPRSWQKPNGLNIGSVATTSNS